MEVMRANGVPAATLLQSGLMRDEVLRLTRSVDVELPEEAIELYEAINGVSEQVPWDKRALYQYFRLLPLEEAIQHYVENVPYLGADTGTVWFPLLVGESDYYFVDSSASQEHRGQIIRYFVEDAPPAQVSYLSVKAMLQTFVECWESGAFSFVEGEFNADTLLEQEISRKYNPGADAWVDGVDGMDDF